MKIKGGAIIWARKTIDSDIFYNKPDKWFKIWFYLISTVNYIDKKGFAKGTCFMKYDWIMKATKATKDQVKHCIEFLKQESMLATQKATHGFIINVLNYSDHQNLSNYESHTERNAKATEKPQKSHNIYNKNKNLKNDKEVKIQNEDPSGSENQEIQIDNLIMLYKEKFPAHIKRYGVSTVMKMRDMIDSAIMEGIKLDDIGKKISSAKKGTPWEIISEKWLNKHKKEKKNYDKLIKRFSNR